MKGKINKVIGEGNIVIPLYILKFFKKLDLSMEEFVFLMYLYNKQDSLDFNPDKIAKDLNMDIMEVMGYVAVLTDKGYITLDVKKSENNVLEEVINLDNFYEKISTFLINFEVESKENTDGKIQSFVEHELGRPLNSLEIKTIDGWKTNNVSDDLIKEALKIALDSGVYNLKFIDRIIVDWCAKGIKNIDELEKDKIMKDTDIVSDIDIGDWNWLDDEEEYITN